MTNDEAYAVIAKHTFVAYRKEYIAKKVFDISSVFVKRIAPTANPQAFTANPQMFEI